MFGSRGLIAAQNLRAIGNLTAISAVAALAALLMLALPQKAAAAGAIKLSPTHINATIAAGDETVERIILDNASAESLVVNIRESGFSGADGAAPFIQVDPEQVTINAGDSTEVDVRIRVPDDAPAATHRSTVLFDAVVTGSGNVAVIGQVAVLVDVNVFIPVDSVSWSLPLLVDSTDTAIFHAEGRNSGKFPVRMKGSAIASGLFASDDSLTAESADVPVGGRAGLDMEWESASVFGLRAVTMRFGAGVGAPVEKKGLVLVFPWKLSLMVILILATAFAGARLLPHLNMMFRRLTTVRVYVTAAVLLLAMAVCAIALLARPPDSGAVVGPLGTYTENTGDIIEICADAACTNHTTTFTRGNTVYVRITTNRVSSVTGGNLRLRNYYDNPVGPGTNWTQVSFTPPYRFTSQVTIPGNASTYEKVVGRLDGAGGTVRFEESLFISPVNQYIRFYSDAARTDESYTFRDGATIYITAYGRNGVTYSQAATGNNNFLYRFDSGTAVYTFPAPAPGSVTNSTNWWYFPLTLPAGLIDGDWYWARTYLRSTAPNTIEIMSRMIQIDNSAPVAAITLPLNGSQVLGPAVAIEGTANDSYSFYRYVVEYGVGVAPATWTQIGATSYTPVVGGPLQTWDTTALADGLHTLRLTVTDRAYNTGVATCQVIVANPPVISAVQAAPVKGTNATVTWTTDELSNSQVEYGTSPGVYTDSTVLDPALVTSHSQVLSNLQPSTVYYYRVRSADAAGNFSYSTEYSFQTLNVTIQQPFPSLGRDTYIGSAQPAWNHDAEALMRAGDYPGVDWGTLRSTIYFDLSGLPVSATIDSATLSLYQSWQGDTSTVNLNAHYLTRDWTEGTGSGAATGDGATWNTYDGTGSWTLAGGDYSGIASGSAAAPNSTSTWVDLSISSLAQSWVTGGIPNYGVLIKQDVENPAGSDAKGYYTADYMTDPSLRPKLTIEWTGTDTTPPNIGEVRAESITRTSATIKWSTDEGATSQVEYGTTTSYGSTTAVDPGIVNQHSVPLTGLTEDTVYHYRVRSIDRYGNESISGDYTFQTAILLTIQPGPADGIDTWLSSFDQTLNYGASTYLRAGNNAAGTSSYRDLLSFDLSQITLGSTVNSATLSLYQYAQADTSTPQLGVYYLTGSWTEGTGDGAATGDGSTWQTSDGVNPWTAAGGDFNATVQATANASGTAGAWVDFNVAGLTQNWVNGTLTNNGMLIKKTVEDGALTDYKDFHSSDYTVDPFLRPKMVIEYVPAPGTITITINETFNRDGSAGGGSVGFGVVTAGTTYYVGDAAAPPYAVKLSVKSNSLWGLKVAATGDLVQLNPSNLMDISNLSWKKDTDGMGSWQTMVKLPSETVIATAQIPNNSTIFLFDYMLTVPAMATSGNYSTTVVYTAYPE